MNANCMDHALNGRRGNLYPLRKLARAFAYLGAAAAVYAAALVAIAVETKIIEL